MRVLTYNILGSRARRDPCHVERIAAVINRLQPDVAGLQEVFQAEDGDLYGDQPGQLEALTGMRCVFWPHLYVRGRAYGNAVLTRGKVGAKFMYCLPHELPLLRALLDVRTGIDDVVVEFFCTHLVHFGFRLRRQRGSQLAQVVRHLADRHHPRVLVGDLNAGWASLDIQALCKAGLFPVCDEEHRTYPAHRPRYCFDHIFTSPTWRCERVFTLRGAASDHLPLVADLSLAPGAIAKAPASRLPGPRELPVEEG